MTVTNSERLEAPERIVVCTDGHEPAVADWAKNDMRECDVEYVRADSLTRARQEAFNEAIVIIDSKRPMDHKCADPKNAEICGTCKWRAWDIANLEAARDRQGEVRWLRESS